MSVRAHPEQVKASVLAMVRAGSSAQHAARVHGVPASTVQLWTSRAGIRLRSGPIGGPAPAPPRRAGRLGLEQRIEIQAGLAARWPLRRIAAHLGVSCSTVSREVRRLGPGPYRALAAQDDCQARSRRPRPGKLAPGSVLRTRVVALLDLGLSPEQVSARLRHEHPGSKDGQVSHETIYQALYLQGCGALRHELARDKALRSGRTSRVARSRLAPRQKPWISADNHITQRPPEADTRAVPGHWEGDLVIGKAHQSCLVTVVERASRFMMMRRLSATDSASVVDVLIEMMAGLPADMRRSLAWDQGNEMSHQLRFVTATDCQVYFCDPHSPWQRPSNENTNGLVRDYFPKGTDFGLVDDLEVQHVQDQLNIRPRKVLDWQCPIEVLNQTPIALTT